MIGYILVVLVVFGKALFPPDGMMIFGDDIHRQYYFFRQFFNEWIGKGIFPWWNPYLFGGEPFIANPVVNIWYPINWLFVVLPLNIAYSWHLAFHVFWAMVGMRKLLLGTGDRGQGTDWGAWTGGLIFGLSGFFMARTWAGHVDVIAAASWMPWTIWAMQKKSIPFAAVVFALQLLSGYQTMAFMTLIAAVLLVRPLQNVGFAALGGVGLAGFQILPLQEFFRASIRTFGFPYTWHSYGAIEWRSLLQLLNPFQFGNQYTYNGPPPNFIEHSMFVGVGGILLALIGLIRRIRPMSLIVVFGLWVALGSNAPVDIQYILWKFVPMYQYLRIPARHLILVVFGLAGLAGIGFTSLKVPTSLKVLIVGIVTIEMVWFARGFIELKPVPETRHDTELIRLVSGDDRILQNFGVWVGERDALDFDSVMPYGIFSATGYDPSILRNYFEYASGGNGKKAVLSHDVQVPYITNPDILDRLNVKYLMVSKTHDPFQNNARYKLVYEKESRVYENTTVKPRFFPACGSAHVTSYTPNRIELTVDQSCDGTLESSEVWYPGWEALVDGNKTDITKSEGTFRTLFVPAGKHTVVYQYSPRVFVYGAFVSVLTATVLFLIFRKIRKPHRV